MPSEWVGVVGALGGAAIGGVVTVASLVVKGRQDQAAEERRNEREDRHRAEDKAAAELQESRDKRQELYVNLLKSSNAIRSSVTGILFAQVTLEDEVQDADISLQQLADRRAALLARLETHRDLTVQATVISIGGQVANVAREIYEDALTIYSGSDRGGWASAGLQDVVNSVNQLTRRLPDEVRRDLGYDPGTP